MTTAYGFSVDRVKRLAPIAPACEAAPMTTPIVELHARNTFTLARDFLVSRISAQLAHGELDRYHREDCEALRPQLDLDACDCDGEEKMRAQLGAILAAVSCLRPDLPSDRLALHALAQPWSTLADFPRI